MKIKLLDAVLLFGLTALVPAAWGESIAPEKQANLLIWTDISTLDYMKYAAENFNKTYNSQVRFTFRGLAPIDAASRMIQDGGSTRVADVAEIEHDLLGRLVVAGGVMENLISAERINKKFMSNAINASRYEGNNYGYATVALFYNKDILRLPPDKFEELIQLSAEFNNVKENKYTLLWDVQNYYESRMFLTLYGAYEFGQEGTNVKDLGINSELAQKGLAAMKRLKTANPSNPVDMRNPQVRRGLFSEGKVAAIIDGPWAIQGYNNSKINFGVVPIPTLEGKQPRSFSTVRLAVVSSYSKSPKAAQLFADYLSSDEMLMKRYEMTESIPPVPNLMNKILPTANEATSAIIKQGLHS
ncbi:extracellular solute-binding protein, partial [Klebsiella pneumoniae]|uniref:extracellular solute-binding protein n=1 Tax=Klebsiella pneumoniae TaxID=573 RepID=UPI000E354EF7